jgi:hypothetical protein
MYQLCIGGIPPPFESQLLCYPTLVLRFSESQVSQVSELQITERHVAENQENI